MTPSRNSHHLTGADLPAVQWHKSSHSNNGGSCVEAAALGRTLLARDSKNPHGPVLVLTPTAWVTLLQTIKTGTLDLL